MTTLRTRKFGKTYHVIVDDNGKANRVEVMNVNGVLRTFWYRGMQPNKRTREIIASAGALDRAVPFAEYDASFKAAAVDQTAEMEFA